VLAFQSPAFVSKRSTEIPTQKNMESVAGGKQSPPKGVGEKMLNEHKK